MRLKPGGLRELHWHANAAEWAFVIKGRVRTTVVGPDGTLGDQRLRPRRRLVFPARPRPRPARTRPRREPFHSRLRQRRLLRVRHVQHHRLARPDAAARPVASASACPKSAFDEIPEGRTLHRPGPRPAGANGNAAPAAAADAVADASLPSAGPGAARPLPRRRRAAGQRPRVPDLDDDHRRDPGPGAGRPARAALAPARQRMAVLHLAARRAWACSAAAAGSASRSSRPATPATSRRGSATTSRTSAIRRVAY